MARSGRTARVAAGRGASARTSASKAGPRARRAPSILAQRRRLELPRQDLWIELLAREMTLAPGLVDRLPARVPVTDPSGSVHGAMLRQEHSNWCWAAVAQCCAGVLKTAGRVWPQCLIANAVLQRADCCDTTGDDIDVVSTLPPALGAVGCRTAEIDGAAPFAEIRRHIDAGQPLAVRFEWQDGRSGAHFFVIDGYEGGPDPKVHILDSFYGPTRGVSYAELSRRYLGHTGRWSDTFLVT